MRAVSVAVGTKTWLMFFKKYHGYLCALLFERRQTFLRYSRVMVVCFFKSIYSICWERVWRQGYSNDGESIRSNCLSENTSLRNVVAIMSNWQVDDVRRWVISSTFDRKMSSKWHKAAKVSLWFEIPHHTGVISHLMYLLWFQVTIVINFSFGLTWNILTYQLAWNWIKNGWF